jgi:AraC-binding-like domain
MTDGAPGAIAPAELTPGVFTTSGLPTARRVELWESHNAAALIGLTVQAPDSLDAAEFNVQLPRARLARVTGSAHSVERTRDLILRCPSDSVAVFLTLRGEARFTADGVALERRRGDALAWEADRPFTRTFARGLEELVVTIPWAELIARSESPKPMAGPVVTSFGAPAAAGSERSTGAAGTARAPRAAVPAGSAWAAGSAVSVGAARSDGSGRPDPYARALARIAGRATRAERPLRPDECTVLDLVAAIVGGPRAAPRRRPPRRRALLYRGAPDRPGPGRGRDRRRRRDQRAPALPALRRRRQLSPPAHPLAPSATGPLDPVRHLCTRPSQTRRRIRVNGRCRADRSRRRCLVRIHVSHLLLTRLLPALQLPRQRPSPRGHRPEIGIVDRCVHPDVHNGPS